MGTQNFKTKATPSRGGFWGQSWQPCSGGSEFPQTKEIRDIYLPSLPAGEHVESNAMIMKQSSRIIKGHANNTYNTTCVLLRIVTKWKECWTPLKFGKTLHLCKQRWKTRSWWSSNARAEEEAKGWNTAKSHPQLRGGAVLALAWVSVLPVSVWMMFWDLCVCVCKGLVSRLTDPTCVCNVKTQPDSIFWLY